MRLVVSILMIGILIPAKQNFDISANSHDIRIGSQFTDVSPDFLDNFELQSGDLVFRKGSGLISDLFTRISSVEQRFSHVGIIVKYREQIMVAHILGTGGTGDQEFRIEPLRHFISGDRARQFGIYRLNISDEVKSKIETYISSINETNILFDDKFDLSTDSALYCSELIYKCIREATNDDACFTTSEAGSKRYVSFDDLIRNAEQLIYCQNQKL